MILIVLALLIAVVGASVVLLIQNWSPVLPLIVLGQTTVTLPLALWILSAVLAGVVTSVILQGLSYLVGSRRARANSRPRDRSGESQPPVSPRPSGRPSGRNRRKPERERPPQPQKMVSEWELEDDFWEEEEERAFEQQPKPEPPETPGEKEWATKQQKEEWDLDKVPRESTIPALKRKLGEKLEEAVNLESLRDQDSSQVSRRVADYQRRKQQRPQPQPPKNMTQSDQQIYDAQYRVIKPPKNPPEVSQDEDNEEEDWI